MHLILVSGNHAKTRTIALGSRHFILLGAVVLAAVVAFSAAVNYALLSYAGRFDLPILKRAESPVRDGQQGALGASGATELDRMAAQLGQMQAQLIRLDALSDQLAQLAGFRPEDLMATHEGRGVMREAPVLPAQLITLAGLTHKLNRVLRRLDVRRDALGALDSLFLLGDVRQKLTPTSLPVPSVDISSSFGWRVNPLTGGREFHQGIDFEAEKGTPILAAAGGVVVYSGFNPQYGNMIGIDHGNGLMTRYAHASKRLVGVGDVVTKGTEIGEVGSTGLATGNHLHFEVRRNGVALNPAQFLRLHG